MEETRGVMDFEITRKVLEALEREKVRYIVCGAVAINLLGLPRATEDLDIFVAPERENIEGLKTALRSVFADPSIEEISADELMGNYPAVQYIPPEGPFHVDILTRLGEAYSFQDLEFVRIDFDGLQVSVATPKTLYLMKKGTVRPKDWGVRRGSQAPVRSGGRLMPVKKIRDLQEMEDSLWYEPGDPELWRAIKAVWSFAERTCPQRFPPGVYKHRTIEDAQRQRDLWEEQNFKAFWERRGIDPKGLSK